VLSQDARCPQVRRLHTLLLWRCVEVTAERCRVSKMGLDVGGRSEKSRSREPLGESSVGVPEEMLSCEVDATQFCRVVWDTQAQSSQRAGDTLTLP
jgi:hypothetical protein